MALARKTIEQRVCLVQVYFRYESPRKCGRKFQRRFPGKPVANRQNEHCLLKTTASLLDKKPDRKRTELTEKTLSDLGARLETSPMKYLKRLAQETGFSITSARRATKL
jgi:hypothetical protein